MEVAKNVQKKQVALIAQHRAQHVTTVQPQSSLCAPNAIMVTLCNPTAPAPNLIA